MPLLGLVKMMDLRLRPSVHWSTALAVVTLVSNCGARNTCSTPLHWSRNIVILTKFSSLVSPEVVILITSGPVTKISFDCHFPFSVVKGRTCPTEAIWQDHRPVYYGSICKLSCHGPPDRYVKLRVAHAPGMPGTFSPPPRVSDPDMHHGTCVTHGPWRMPGSLTSGFLRSRWRGKRYRHSRRMHNPQFYVSGKRPIGWNACVITMSLRQAGTTNSSKFYRERKRTQI